jgi:hypothetical protein
VTGQRPGGERGAVRVCAPKARVKTTTNVSDGSLPPSGAGPTCEVTHSISFNTSHLGVDLRGAARLPSTGRLQKQVVEHLALTLIERAEHLVLDRREREFGLRELRRAGVGELDHVSAPILGRASPFDQVLGLELVEQADDVGPVHLYRDRIDGAGPQSPESERTLRSLLIAISRDVDPGTLARERRCELAHALAAMNQLDRQFEDALIIVQDALEGLTEELGPYDPRTRMARSLMEWIKDLAGPDA